MSDEGPDLPEESESYTNWFVSTLSAHPPVRTTLSTLPGLNEKDPQDPTSRQRSTPKE